MPRLLRPRPRPLPRRLRDLRASERLRKLATADSDEIAAEIAAQYPPRSLVRPRWYIPAPDNLAATWLRDIEDADLALAPT